MADLAAAVASLVAARSAQMVDACTVTRPATVGQTPVLDADGNVASPAGTTVYSGACLLARFRSTGVRATMPTTLTDQSGIPEPRTLKVPEAADLRPGDVVTMTDCVISPSLTGRRFLVIHEDPRTYATFRAFTVRGSSWRSSEAGP